MIRYLKHIERIWDIIINCGDTILLYSVIDGITVEKLEGLYLKYSASDRDSIVALMQERMLFPLVVN
jgi:hypothetical protein